jgi:TRAP-type transport system small permease protein
MSRLSRLMDVVSSVCRLLASLCLGTMACVVIYAVLARYLLGSAPAWSEEVPRLLLIWGALLGAVVAERNGSHLTAGVLPLVLHDAKRLAIIAKARALVSLLIHGTFAVAFYDFVSRTIYNKLPALKISVAVVYSSGVVAFSILTLVVLVGLLERRIER